MRKSKTAKKCHKSLKKMEESATNRQKVYKITSRIYKELRNNQYVSFKKLRGYQGEYDYCDDAITIDPRREILPTLVHEFIHKWYPFASESWVLSKERFVMKYITPSQAKHLLAALSDII